MSLAPFLLLLSPAIPSAHALVCLTPESAQVPVSGRPDQGVGMYAFDDVDEVVSVDGPYGRVRVHYSEFGPNQTDMTDDDDDGVPDFPQQVAATAEDVIAFYESLGFRAPLTEEDMGLGELGGSYALDFYLVDFGGQADGMFSLDACTYEPDHCSGFMVMENDFSGYGYASQEQAIATLTSHELFHAVQYAYEDDSPTWYSEGSAVWAERQFDPENEDFLYYASAYLEDTTRSLDDPPSGPVQTFAYATAIFWHFLTDRLGTEALVDLQENLEWDGEERDTLTELLAVLERHGSSLEQEWTTFTRWNAATGLHAGTLESYSFAADLDEVLAEGEGEVIQDDNRFYPIAATYYRIDHPGGPLYFSNTDDASGLVFTLFSVADGASDGELEAQVATWEPDEPSWITVADDLPEGGYWMVGAYPVAADNSQKVAFCLGDESTAAACVDAPPADTGTGTGGPGGCSCAAARNPHRLPPFAGWGLGVAALAWGLGRRQRRATAPQPEPPQEGTRQT